MHFVISRREANKQATREALIRAAVDLAREYGVDQVTADMVAERVGVSRRTFFNYFPTLDQCLSATFSEAVTKAVEAFTERPADEPVLTSARHAFAEVLNPAATSDMVWVMRASIESGRVGALCEIWHQANDSMVASLRERAAGADDLWIRSLAASIIGVAQSVFFAWMTRDPESQDIEATHSRFQSDMARSLAYLSQGFETSVPSTIHS